MKIAIISDTHDNLENLIKALTLINKEKVSALIHCGDVTSIDALKLILQNFKKNIYLSLGNGDNENIFFDFLKQNKNFNLIIFKKFGEFIIDNLKFGISHFPEEVKKGVYNDNFDFCFYGHIHRPWQEKIGNTLILNPGNLAGIFYRSTFAILDTKTLDTKLIIVN